jgi:hypothetical protein
MQAAFLFKHESHCTIRSLDSKISITRLSNGYFKIYNTEFLKSLKKFIEISHYKNLWFLTRKIEIYN